MQDLQDAELAGNSETLQALLSFLPQLISITSKARYDAAERVRATARSALVIMEDLTSAAEQMPESPL